MLWIGVLSTALAGDLWLNVQSVGTDGQEVHAALPASWMAEAEGELTFEGVDLKALARDVASRPEHTAEVTRVASDEGELLLTMVHLPVAQGEGARQLVVDTVGPKGNAFTLGLPLSVLTEAPEQAEDLPWSPDCVEQLRHSAPTRILHVRSPREQIVVRTE